MATTTCDGIHVHALPASAPERGRGKALALRVATAAVVAGGVWLLVPRLGEVSRALALLAHGSAGWIVLAA